MPNLPVSMLTFPLRAVNFEGLFLREKMELLRNLLTTGFELETFSPATMTIIPHEIINTFC